MKSSEIKAELNSIREKYGKLIPRYIVDEARDESHPLHGEFDWNDATAADKHRLAVAAALMLRVKYLAQDVEAKEVEVPYYPYNAQIKAHVPMPDVIRSKKQSMQLLLEELKRCEGIIRRAQRIADALNLRRQLDGLLHKCIDTIDYLEAPKAKAPPKKLRGKANGKSKSNGEARPHA